MQQNRHKVGARSRVTTPPSRRRLRIMQKSCEAILHRWDGIQQHDCADLSAMDYAMGDHMYQHFLARHTARSAVSEYEIDRFYERVGIEGRYILDILPIAFPDVGG